MRPWSEEANYTSGPDTGTTTKTVPGYTTFTDGVGVAAQEMNYLMNQRDNRLLTALAGANNWTPLITAATVGGYSALTCASYVDSSSLILTAGPGQWLIGAGNASGSGNCSVFTTDGLGDADFSDVSTAPLSGGVFLDVDFNQATFDVLGMFFVPSSMGTSLYKCPNGGNWTVVFNVATAITGRPVVKYTTTGHIVVAYVTGGNVVILDSTNNGSSFTSTSFATSGVDTRLAYNSGVFMVMTSDGAYHVGSSVSSLASFANPFPGGQAVANLVWAWDMNAWFATTSDGTNTRVWKSSDGVGWTQQSAAIPFLSYGAEAAGDCLAMSIAFASAEHRVFFSTDEGLTWHPGPGHVQSPGSGLVSAPRVFSGRAGFVNVGQQSMRFSQRCGLPNTTF